MDAQRSDSPPGAMAALIKAARRILHPLVRLLLAHGVKFPQCSHLLMSVYVRVAEAELRAEHKPQLQGEISERTGLLHGDVQRLMEEHRCTREVPEDVARGVQLASLWLSDPAYRDEMGVPSPLPRLASIGRERSFESLVNRVSKTLRFDAVLEEWLRLGMVTVDGDDRVHMKADAFVPHKGVAEKMFFLGQNVHDHLDSAVHNVMGAGPPRLERSVFYDGLSEESLAQLAELAHKRGMEVLLELNSVAKSLRDQDTSDATGTRRMNFGMYFFEGPQGEP